MLAPSVQDRVLDIGFGNGYLLRRLAKSEPCSFFGIDISDNTLQAAHRRNRKSIEDGRMPLLASSAEAIPFESAYFSRAYTVLTV